MSLYIAVLMWALVLSLSIRAPKRTQNTLLWCALLIALSLSTNVSFAYLALEMISPFPNFTDLLSNLALIVGLYLLASSIVRGARTAINDKRGTRRIANYGVVLVMIIMIASFSMIEMSHSSTRFMLDFGDQLPAAVYSGVQYLYLSLIFAEAMIICVRAIPQMTIMRFRIGFSIIVVGFLFGILLGMSVILMDILHLNGDLDRMRAVGGIYDVLRLGTVFFLCVGLSIPTLGKQLGSSKSLRQAVRIEPKLHEVWTQTVGERNDQSLSVNASLEKGDAMERLHRMVVEICDWSLNAEGSKLSSSQAAILDQAESLCIHAASMRQHSS